MLVFVDNSASQSGSILRLEPDGPRKSIDCELLDKATGVASMELPIDARFAAIYAEEEVLILALDEQRWSVTESLKFVCLDSLLGLRRTFKVLDDGRELFSASYWNPRFVKIRNWLEVVYDEFDKEADDFFYYLAKNCNDPQWRSTFRKKWSAR